MNSTNRFLNRLFVLIAGLVLLVAGVGVCLGALIPGLQQPISDAALDAAGEVPGTLDAQPWILWAAAAAAAVIITVLFWFVLRQGRGRTSVLLESGGTGGDVVIDAKVAAHVLEQSLARHPRIVSVDVVAFQLRGERVLRITVQARRGSSPVHLRSLVDQSVAEWDALLGQQVPVVIQIVSGLRADLTGTARVA